MAAWLAALALSCVSGACGDDDLVRVQLAPSGDQDPFEMVDFVRVTVDAPDIAEPVVQLAPYRSGAQVRLSAVPFGEERVLTVEGLDGEELVVSRGRSEAFALLDDEPRDISVTISRCPLLLYRDGDADGFGDDVVQKTLCEPTDGFVEADGDCDDLDPDAYVDQPSFFEQPTLGTDDFDYNCDGTEEREINNTVDCAAAGSACKASGWLASVPQCGEEGTWTRCSKQSSSCVVETTETKVQRCH